MDEVTGFRGWMFAGNFLTAVAYYFLSYQIFVFTRSPKLLSFLDFRGGNKSKRNELKYMLTAIVVLFELFIALCGNTHILQILLASYPNNHGLQYCMVIMLFLCAVVSLLTAGVVFMVFPVILNTLDKFELNSEGKLQHAENYLLEVVEMFRESIIVLSQSMHVLRCNKASQKLFGSNMMGQSILSLIHPEDLSKFQSTLSQVTSSYQYTSSVVEYRVRVPRSFTTTSSSSTSSGTSTAKGDPHSDNTTSSRAKMNTAGDMKDIEAAMHAAASAVHAQSGNVTMSPLQHPSRVRLAEKEEEEEEGRHSSEHYIWVESTICLAQNILEHGDAQDHVEINMISRNVNDRKEQEQYKDMLEATKQTERYNEAKLRYISCVAHDLKTPLTSFCFSLDLLQHSDLTADQREYVNEAAVSVDLMQLTVSQTMDISKVLTGTTLQPRRATVSLSQILKKVSIIITGYAKQVPVSFESAPNVTDTVITDEEWVWQMLLNFLTNACKYTDRGQIHVKLSIVGASPSTAHSLASSHHHHHHLHEQQHHHHHHQRQEESMLLFEVIDTGIGIRSDKMDTLFDAFSQVQSGQMTGTGLGLFGLRTRAEGLGGACGARLNTSSSTGTGSVFWFTIPYVEDKTAFSAFRSTATGASTTPAVTVPEMLKVSDSPDMSPTKNLLNLPSVISTTSFCSDASSSKDFASPTNLYGVKNPRQPNAVSPSYSNDRSDSKNRNGTIGNSTLENENDAKSKTAILQHNLTAYVVDDVPSIRKLMQNMLLRIGFAKVDCFVDGKKGLDALMQPDAAGQQPDIVFSDVQMPIMTGPEMVRRFRQFEREAGENGTRARRQVIIAVTANGSESELENAEFDEVCAKPLNRGEIHRVVDAYLSKRYNESLK